MSQAPGQNIVPFEAFEVRAADDDTVVYNRFVGRVLSSGKADDANGKGGGDDVVVTTLYANEAVRHFRTIAEAKDYLSGQIQFRYASRSQYKIVPIDTATEPPSHPQARPSPPHPPPHPNSKSHSVPPPRPAQRASQTEPPRTSDGKPAKPAPAPRAPAQRTDAPSPAQRAASERPAGPQGPPAPRPAQEKSTQEKTARERASAPAPEASAGTRRAKAALGGFEQFLADASGLGPMVLAGTGNVYGAYLLHQQMEPVVKGLEESAAQHLHEAEGSEDDPSINTIAYAAMVIPGLIQPEEEAAVDVEISLARLARMAEAAASGEVRSVVTNKALLEQFTEALRSAKLPKDKWSNLRRRLGNRMEELFNKDIHHWLYPRRKYPTKLLDPENLLVASRRAHTLLHQAEGIPGWTPRGRWLVSKSFESMDPQFEKAGPELRNMFRFWEPAVRPELPAGVIDEFLARLEADVPGGAATSMEAVTAPATAAEGRAVARSGVPLSVQLEETLAWAQHDFGDQGVPIRVQIEEALAWAQRGR